MLNSVGTYNFYSDLAKGNQAERFAAGILIKHFGGSLQRQMGGNHPAFDLEMLDGAGRLYTVEVKADLKCFETGNIAIEVGHVDAGRARIMPNLKPSGITTTEADLVVYVVRLHESPDIAIHAGSRAAFMRLENDKCRFSAWSGDDCAVFPDVGRFYNSMVRYTDLDSCPDIDLLEVYSPQ